MNTTLRKEIVTETYQDLDKMIWELAFRFYMTYGGDIDEIKAEANLLFVKACDSYKNNYGKITTWVYSQIYYKLQRAWSRNLTVPTIELPEEKLIAHKLPKKHSWEFWDELGADAKTMARALFDGTEGLTETDLENGFSACQTRKQIKLYFRKVGWTHRRIKETIQEIKRIIND